MKEEAFFCCFGNLLKIVKSKNSIRKLILLRKIFFGSQSLNIVLSITDLKAARKVWKEKTYVFNICGATEIILAIRQQFRVDFRMAPDTFMDIVTLVRNRLENKTLNFVRLLQLQKEYRLLYV